MKQKKDTRVELAKICRRSQSIIHGIVWIGIVGHLGVQIHKMAWSLFIRSKWLIYKSPQKLFVEYGTHAIFVRFKLNVAIFCIQN